jgi:hypothetical protein
VAHGRASGEDLEINCGVIPQGPTSKRYRLILNGRKYNFGTPVGIVVTRQQHITPYFTAEEVQEALRPFSDGSVSWSRRTIESKRYWLG